MTWDHGQLRTTKETQTVRPFSKVISSDFQYCKWAMDYDSGLQVALGTDARPLWWYSIDETYPAWTCYDLPATLLEGELPNIPYALDQCRAIMQTRVDVLITHHPDDTTGTTYASFYPRFSLRSGETNIADFYGEGWGTYWSIADYNDPHYYHPITGAAEFKTWQCSTTTIGKQGLVPDNIRFRFILGISGALEHANVEMRVKCEDYLAIVFPDYIP